jgi:signal transduction histidine kinase
MRYADTLLTEGEVAVLRTRQHWLALLVRSRAALLLWLAGIVLLGLIIFLNVQQEVLRNIVSGVALVLLGLGVMIFVYRLWHWWAQDYVVTNRRLLKVTGILNKRSADSSLEKINDAILTQSILGRILNYGDLEILTAAEMANDMYRMLNAPKEFKKTMLTQKHALETEFMYGRPPSPPLRATDDQTTQRPPEPMTPQPPAEPTPMAAVTPEPLASAPAAAPAAPVAAAPAAGPEPAAAARPASEEDESLEVTELLAQLADLRDEGAITPEEYEQKKDELLNRL